MGVPAVFVFSGLSHTADRIGKLEGLSRPSNNAIVNIERGVLTFAHDRRYEVAIPSMARWLGVSHGRKKPTGGGLD